LRAARLARTFREKHSYELSELDDTDSARAIARETVKESFLEKFSAQVVSELAGGQRVPSSEEAKALLSGLLGGIEAIKEQMITMEMPEYDWRSRTLSFEAKVILSPKVAARIIAVLLNREVLVRDMLGNRAIANRAMEEIDRMQNSIGTRADGEALAERYQATVDTLVAANWFERAQFNLIAGKLTEAEEAYTKSIEASAGHAVAYKNRGALYLYHQNDTTKFSADLKGALAAYGSNAQSHMVAQEYKECLEDVEAALEISPDYAHAYYQRAACNKGLGLQDNVRKDLVRAARLGNGSARDLLTAKGVSWQNGVGR